MDTGVDFTYFSSAPVPVSYYGLPPTPQSNTPRGDDFKSYQSNDPFDPAFAAAFQHNFQYDPSQFVTQPHHTHHQIASITPAIQSMQQRPPLISLPTDQSYDQFDDTAMSPTDPTGLQRSSSEEKDNLTPQQNKRKAQNRAAQRAFRERKEKRVKDLEARNTTLQHQYITLQTELERLRRELTRATTENEILRATSGSSSNGPAPFLLDKDRDDLDSVVPGPLGYTPTDYSSKLRTTKESTTDWVPNAKWAQFGVPIADPIDEENGEPLYTAGQTWDYIQRHELFKKGLVDVGDVCERLKKAARCGNGHGPVFLEGDIRKAIQESAVAGGRDELI
ncbi:AP-1-like transcription factor [Lithohypha guttulata]|uniref:AP-1-like transcription factor n=1 Tax=Lithohypha guttulata TaxID=1690604 RepID=UPI002DDEA46B|nr:AP-1-like transcription factor [Lithohypha guttulata]KAK5106152.1 AP-1-like transcription factor [Lithohypha guttulata]